MQPAVRTDPQLVARVLQNLVSNALKYTPEGRVLVGCRRRRDHVAIEVLDTGIGISPAEQEVIFKEFRRLDSGARIAAGLGLGLSIVERIARVLDIQLSLTSAPERGTRISLLVPLARAPQSARHIAARRPQLAATEGMLVLCVDNDDRILNGMNALLSGWGCEPVMAKTAREAMHGLQATGRVPDLMLVDYHLDQGDGLAAIVQIRAKLDADIPAVLITADRSPDLRELAQKAGVRVLHKPLKPAALRAWMTQWGAARAAAE